MTDLHEPAAQARVSGELLEARVPAGYWVGELSSSALSTATAVCALAVVEREFRTANTRLAPLIKNGLDWLATHINPDGGWGDTTRSISNISTTALCWAAFASVPSADQTYRETVKRAEQWLTERAGGIKPEELVPAIVKRYGKDRTFSVPILTMCALAGRLGSGRQAWRWVLPLPFELAAFPPAWFAALRLPVVSYALPALIAIGQARHHHLPSRNPIARLCRNLTRARTLNLLTRIQPASGGFLEATPLTSFVVMSLASSGQAEHTVTKKGVEFLMGAARSDGSWAIDSNLATWLTTLSVNALVGNDDEYPSSAAAGCSDCDESSGSSASFREARRSTIDPSGINQSDASDESAIVRAIPSPWGEGQGEGKETELPPNASTFQKADRLRIRDWLLNQQHREVHPYTQAKPGGWAWTDLPGGVPDADDTAGAVLALRRLGILDDRTRDAAFAGIRWLLDLQNRDGGIPTFCRGWGALPFDRSSPDLTAHALRAWFAWLEEIPAELASRVRKAIPRALRYLGTTQRPDGSWIPLWFGNQLSPDDENPTYGTARVLVALNEVAIRGQLENRASFERGIDWLLSTQLADGAWSGFAGGEPSIEETALAFAALAACGQSTNSDHRRNQKEIEVALAKAATWLLEKIESGHWREPSPIGFYFAKLWYYEKLYPLIFTTAALGRMIRTKG